MSLFEVPWPGDRQTDRQTVSLNQCKGWAHQSPTTTLKGDYSAPMENHWGGTFFIILERVSACFEIDDRSSISKQTETGVYYACQLLRG